MIVANIINRSDNPLPAYETLGSAGMDVRSDESVSIHPFSRAIVGTGLFVAIPTGYEIQVRPRSGLAAKTGITVLNSPGTIDSDYRGEIKVILFNASRSLVSLDKGERIAQLVLNAVPQIEWQYATDLPETTRGSGGLGSTGTN